MRHIFSKKSERNKGSYVTIGIYHEIIAQIYFIFFNIKSIEIIKVSITVIPFTRLTIIKTVDKLLIPYPVDNYKNKFYCG